MSSTVSSPSIKTTLLQSHRRTFATSTKHGSDFPSAQGRKGSGIMWGALTLVLVCLQSLVGIRAITASRKISDLTVKP